MPTKNFKDFCSGSFLKGRAEILKIFGRLEKTHVLEFYFSKSLLNSLKTHLNTILTIRLVKMTNKALFKVILIFVLYIFRDLSQITFAFRGG